jgi:coenzyme Q-binding protein COQ10
MTHPMSFATRRVLPYAADDLYALVADVERYPAFVPLLTEATVLARRPDGFDARLGVGIGFLRERWTSRVTLDPGSRRIRFHYVDGPLRALQGAWRFRPVDGATEVEFRVRWEFASGRLDGVARKLFDVVSARMIQAFERESKRLGRRGRMRSPSSVATGERA